MLLLCKNICTFTSLVSFMRVSSRGCATHFEKDSFELHLEVKSICAPRLRRVAVGGPPMMLCQKLVSGAFSGMTNRIFSVMSPHCHNAVANKGRICSEFFVCCPYCNVTRGHRSCGGVTPTVQVGVVKRDSSSKVEVLLKERFKKTGSLFNLAPHCCGSLAVLRMTGPICALSSSSQSERLRRNHGALKIHREE